jgi:FKBP-type peptidyl-prolyl cis-trans isomerase SlpA
MQNMVVEKNSRVLAHLVLTLADGSIAQATRAEVKPALLQLGDGSLSPQLETELFGLKVGDKKQFTLAPLQAYGEASPDLIQYFNRREFANSGSAEVGAIILFSAMDGSERPGIIRDISGDSVTVDFNHPLAGQAVTFEVEVLQLNPQLEVNNANSIG